MSTPGPSTDVNVMKRKAEDIIVDPVKKYAAAVKRAMSHIPCIDEIIELTKNTKQASEISSLTTLVAEILLVTTARHVFPISIFNWVWAKENYSDGFIDFFSTTVAGGWYAYKSACEGGVNWTISGAMEEEKASQIIFHGIFGTFKEDLAILEEITDVSCWFTREELGSCFRQQGTSERVTKITLPKIQYYSKMSCANQTGLPSGVYSQVATVPCFSGQRVHLFDSEFFDHIEKRRAIGASGKCLSQIINTLTTALEDLHEGLRKREGKQHMGTTTWRRVDDLLFNYT